MAKDESKRAPVDNEERDDEDDADERDEAADDGDADEDDAKDDDAEDDDAEDDDAEDDDAEDEAGEDEAGEDEDEGDEAEDEEEDEDDGEEPRKKAAAVAGAKPKAGGDKADPPAAVAPAGRARHRRRVVQKRGSPTRNIILFVILVGGLAAAFGIFGSTGGDGGPAPAAKWKEGTVVPVEITLVTTDYKNLACAMAEEVKGRYCAFESQNKRNPKSQGDVRAEENLLQPFTTTDQIQFMASGLWMDPALKAKLDKENWERPSPRFSVTCQFSVEGRTNTAFVQWKPGEGWHSGNGWYTGSVKDCKLQ
jgi:hypothetical protein